MEWDLEAERQLWRHFCAREFWWFLRIGWGVELYMRNDPSNAWLTPRLHRPICNWLQARVEAWEENRSHGIKRRTKVALIIPRSFGKTVIGTKALTLWAQLRNPDISSFIGSETATKAIDFLYPIKLVMEGTDPNAWFVWLFGTWCNPDRPWSATKLVHGARRSTARSEASFDTWAVEGGITGDHPDWGVFDDPLSEEKLKESGTWIYTVNQSLAALRPAFRTDSFFMLSLTRYRDNDVVGTYLPLEGVRSWSGMDPPNGQFEPKNDGEWDVYFLQALDGSGESIFPEIWPTPELRKYEETRPIEFAAQMMNEPGSGEHMALTSEQIGQMWVEPNDVPRNLILTIHIDTAFKTPDRKGRGDESVIQVWGHDPKGSGDVYYLEGYGSDRWRIEDFTDELLKIVQRRKRELYRIKAITDEKEMGGKTGAWINWLQSAFHGAGLVLPPIIQLNRTRSRKHIRIQEAAGFWVDGHVRLVRGSPGVQKLIAQMVRAGISSHDDWSDAAADVFAQEVYQPMLNPIMGSTDEGGWPAQPGDNILGRRLTNDEVRQIYDFANDRFVTDWELDDKHSG